MAAVAATATKTMAETAMAGGADNNQPKAAAEEMAVETAMEIVTTKLIAMTMMAAAETAVVAVFLPN